MPLFVPEANSPIVNDWARAERREFHYSHLVAGEFNSAISRLVRMGEFDEEQAQAIRELASEWLENAATCSRIYDEHVEIASRVVAKPSPKLLMPDAIHLTLCASKNLTLVTFDEDLLVIAKREGVEALMPA
jgi:predicted nucleic acid-binding protein